MQGWKEYKLNELGKLNRGKSRHRPRNEPSLYGGKYPFVQTGNIKSANFYITEYDQTYSEKGLAQSKLWKKGTLCVTIAANIAETAILGIDACFPDSIIGFVADEKKSDVKFIKYHFDLLKLHLQSISQGTTQDNLSQEKLLTFTFTVPEDIKQQQHIAFILSTYDDLIEVNNQRIKLLEDTAREVYKEWFVRMRFPGYRKAKFVKGLPVSWDIICFRDFIKLNRGFDLPDEKIDEGDYPVVASTSIKAYHNQYKVEAPCVSTGRSGSLGTVQYINQKSWPLNTSLYVKDFKGNSPRYVFYFLQNLNLETFNAGAGVPSLNQNHLHGLKFSAPPISLQIKFDDFVVPIFNQIENLQQQNTQLRQIRDRLLPRLISGKLAVKQPKEYELNEALSMAAEDEAIYITKHKKK
jgi:type I restriction enzyme, S subunit